MAGYSRGVEHYAAGCAFPLDGDSSSLEQQTCFPGILTSSESDISAAPPACSLSSVLPLGRRSSSEPALHAPSSSTHVRAPPQLCPGYYRQRSSDWQAQQVSISTFVRRFPSITNRQSDEQPSSTSRFVWADLPQIEHMVHAGYMRPPVCQPGALTVGRLLGCGGQAQIHEAVLCENGRSTRVVVKEFIGEHGDDEMTAEEVDTELCACWVLRGHHHVAPVLGVVECPIGHSPLSALRGTSAAGPRPPPQTVRALVMQRFTGSLQGTLEALRASSEPDKRTLSTGTLLRVIVALSNALACAHGRGMLHMDVKPANVLVQEKAPGVLADPSPCQVSPVVLTDFGTSILPWDPRAVHGLCGTLDYHPPELALTDMKFAAEMFDSGDEADACTRPGLPSPDSTSSPGLTGALSMDGPALARAASSLFDEKMDVWGLGILMYECLAEHLPLESVTDPHVILARVATGTGMASAAPTFALLPCHKAVLALCQWVTAPRPEDRPAARQLHCVAAELLVSLCEHAAAARGRDGDACGGDASECEVIACGEVLTLGRATRVHAPAAAGATDAIVATTPLMRPGDIVVHPLVGIVSLGSARPSPEPFAGPLAADVAARLQAAADTAAADTAAADTAAADTAAADTAAADTAAADTAAADTVAAAGSSTSAEEFVDARNSLDSSAEDFGSPAAPQHEAESHAVIDDLDEPQSPPARRNFGNLLDTLLLAGAGFGYGGAAAAAAASCRSCGLVQRLRGAAEPPLALDGGDCIATAAALAEAPPKHAAASIAVLPESPRIGTTLSGGGDAVCAHAYAPDGRIPSRTPAPSPHARLALPLTRLSSPHSPLAPMDAVERPALSPMQMYPALMPATMHAAHECAVDSIPGPSLQPVPAYMPTLQAIPSVAESEAAVEGGGCSSSEAIVAPATAAVAACAPHDIMETTTSCGSSDDSAFEEALCVRAVIGTSPGGFPGPTTSPGLPLSCMQRRGVAGSIFFVPSPRTKFRDPAIAPLRTCTADALTPRDALNLTPRVSAARAPREAAILTPRSTAAAPPSGPCTRSPAAVAGAPSSHIIERVSARRRIDFVNLGSASTEGGSFLCDDGGHCPAADGGSDCGRRLTRRQWGAEQLRLPLDSSGARADIRRLLGSSVTDSIGQHSRPASLSSLIPSPRDWQAAEHVIERSMQHARQACMPAEDDTEVLCSPGELTSRRTSFLHRMRSFVPRLSDVASRGSRVSFSPAASVDGECCRRLPSRASESESSGSDASLSLADTVSVCAQSAAGSAQGDGQNSSPIAAHATPRWRAAAAQVRARSQDALAAGLEKVAVSREKGRLLLASVSVRAEGARSLLRKVKAATARSVSTHSSTSIDAGGVGHEDARRRVFGRWGRWRGV
eukprot:jgi/Ulvmu1/1183/UM108_0011.1